MIEQKLWHIHVDAKERMEDGLRTFLHNNGFSDTNFLQERPFGLTGAPPPLEHLTRKFRSPQDYQDTWRIVKQATQQNWNFVGYLEEEKVSDIELPFKQT